MLNEFLNRNDGLHILILYLKEIIRISFDIRYFLTIVAMGNVPDAPACTVARVSPLQGGIARGLKQKYGADTLTACRGS